MYNANPQDCTHPAQIRRKDGLMHCLVCGADFKPAAKKPPKADGKNDNKKADEKADKKAEE